MVPAMLVSLKGTRNSYDQYSALTYQYMQNVTISLEESALAWAENEAKKRNCSVSTFLGQLLKEEMLIEVAGKQPSPYSTPTK